jgi:hypothetical protein
MNGGMNRGGLGVRKVMLASRLTGCQRLIECRTRGKSLSMKMFPARKSENPDADSLRFKRPISRMQICEFMLDS